MDIRPGIGDDFLNERGVRFIIDLELPPRIEEPFLLEPDLILDPFPACHPIKCNIVHWVQRLWQAIMETLDIWPVGLSSPSRV